MLLNALTMNMTTSMVFHYLSAYRCLKYTNLISIRALIHILMILPTCFVLRSIMLLLWTFTIMRSLQSLLMKLILSLKTKIINNLGILYFKVPLLSVISSTIKLVQKWNLNSTIQALNMVEYGLCLKQG